MRGHLTALLTILIWGSTFVSTKVLLNDFSPLEILFIRFVMGLAALTAIYPKFMRLKDKKHELLCAAAGVFGICLYYLLENIALVYTSASHVGIIIAAAPFFTAVIARITDRSETIGGFFVLGFALAMAGIICLNFDSGAAASLRGDLLAVSAAAVWAAYSVIVRKISAYGYNTIQTTQRIFFYGIAAMLPFALYFGAAFDIGLILKPANVFNLLFLGLGASALCFVLWNSAVECLGAVKTSAYIYLVPVITILTANLAIGEPITQRICAGTILVLAGLAISEYSKSR